MEKPTEENGAPYEIDGNSRFDLSSGTWWATCSIKFKISIFLLASIFRVKRFILSRWSKTCWRNLIAEISASLIHSMAIDPPRQWPLGGSINRISVNFNFLVRNYIQRSDSCRITRVTVPLAWNSSTWQLDRKATPPSPSPPLHLFPCLGEQGPVRVGVVLTVFHDSIITIRLLIYAVHGLATV